MSEKIFIIHCVSLKSKKISVMLSEKNGLQHYLNHRYYNMIHSDWSEQVHWLEYIFEE